MAIGNEFYLYRAKVVSVYDGDTFRADVDLGLFVEHKAMQFRLLGVDTPEIREEEYEQGIIARDWVREKILGKEVVIRTYKKGTYRRWLAEVFLSDDDGTIDYSTTLNELLLEKGLAEEYNE